MNMSTKKYSKVIASMLVVGIIFSSNAFMGVAYAAPISKTNPIIVHVPGSGFLAGNTTQQATKNLLDGARTSGVAGAEKQMQDAINNGTIQIKEDAPTPKVLQGAATDSTSRVTFEGKQYGANGKDGIKQGLNEILKNQANLPADQAKPLQDECIFMQGGNVENQFTPPGGVKTAGSASGFGKYNPANPLDPATNSPENILLAEKKVGTYQQRWDEVSKQAQADSTQNKGKKTTIYLPNAGQSVDGALVGQYQVNGVEVKTGSKYTVGQTGTDGVTVDENCNPTKGAAPKDPAAAAAAPGSDSGFGGPGGSGGGGSGGGGGGLGGGALGGLGQMLPLLLAGMLGGGLGNKGNTAGQGQNGTGTTNPQVSCAQYGVSPVCGSDGKTYNNSCWLQQLGQVQVSAGVCPTTSPSPSPSPDVAKIVTQLLSAGVPQSVIDEIVSALTVVAGNVSSNQVTVQ